jgi:hypothetical protein
MNYTKKEIIEEFIGDYREDYFFRDVDLNHGIILSGDIEKIELYLLNCPWLVDASTSMYQCTALHICCQYNLDEEIYLLLRFGSKLCRPNSFGMTPRQMAFENSSEKSYRVLEEYSATIIQRKWREYLIMKHISKMNIF